MCSDFLIESMIWIGRQTVSVTGHLVFDEMLDQTASFVWRQFDPKPDENSGE